MRWYKLAEKLEEELNPLLLSRLRFETLTLTLTLTLTPTRHESTILVVATPRRGRRVGLHCVARRVAERGWGRDCRAKGYLEGIDHLPRCAANIATLPRLSPPGPASARDARARGVVDRDDAVREQPTAVGKRVWVWKPAGDSTQWRKGVVQSVKDIPLVNQSPSFGFWGDGSERQCCGCRPCTHRCIHRVCAHGGALQFPRKARFSPLR